MFVREVGLNNTMFVTWDGKRMYYPNNVLSQKPIHNVRRSPNMSEKIGTLTFIFLIAMT
jgi:small-conductance mechanosensitive channel